MSKFKKCNKLFHKTCQNDKSTSYYQKSAKINFKNC